MNVGPWKVAINRPDWSIDSSITIYRYVGDDVDVLQHKDGNWITERIPRGAVSPGPTIGPLREDEMRGILAAFVEAAGKMGVKLEEGAASAKLAATELHLEDMRRLAFEGKDRDLKLPHE